MSSRLWLMSVVAALGTAAAGCTNALYFYETGKISLTLEARPDNSQPVQGNLGFKQRTVVVSPPIGEVAPNDTDPNGKPPKIGDAAAMIASFRFTKEPGAGLNEQGSLFGPLDVRTALVTGLAVPKAAEKRQAVAQAITAKVPDPDRFVAGARTNIDEIELSVRGVDGTADEERLTRVFLCYGQTRDDAKRLAKRYAGKTPAAFKQAFERDWVFQTEAILTAWRDCT